MKRIAALIAVCLLAAGCRPAYVEPGLDNIDLPTVTVIEQPPSDTQEQDATSADTELMPNYNEYHIALTVNPETRIITGSQRVVYINKSQDTLDRICFNVSLNAFSTESTYQPFFSEFWEKMFPNGRDYSFMSFSSILAGGEATTFYLEGTSLIIHLENSLPPGETAEVSMQYEAYIPEINHRTGANRHAMWMGAFIPTVSVYEKGEWRLDPYYSAGDPFYTETANYNVSITTPKLYSVVGPGSETVREEDDFKTTSFNAQMIRDFAFAVIQGYRELSLTTRNGIELTLHYRQATANIDAFMDNAEIALDFYSNYVGSYPYGKLKIVETGLFLSGGMEFSQVIFMDANYMRQPESINTLHHEIGHQWFYNIVGSDQINAPWMDEGLTSMLQQKMLLADPADLEALREVFEADYEALQSRLPDYNSTKLSDNLSNYTNWSNYYNIQYVKGKLMVYSLNVLMGEEVFNEFIRAYYNRFSYGVATQGDFIATAEEIYGESLTDFFNSWIYGDDLPPLYY